MCGLERGVDDPPLTVLPGSDQGQSSSETRSSDTQADPGLTSSPAENLPSKAPTDIPTLPSEVQANTPTSYIDSSTDPLFGDLPISYHPDFHVFRCAECDLIVSSLLSHFNHSHMLDQATKESILKILTKYPQSDPNDRLPTDISIQNPYPKFINGIGFSSTGFSCGASGCSFISDTSTIIINHMYNVHRVSQLESGNLYTECRNIQSFFLNKTQRKWFPSSAPCPISGLPKKADAIPLICQDQSPVEELFLSSRARQPPLRLADEQRPSLARLPRRSLPVTASGLRLPRSIQRPTNDQYHSRRSLEKSDYIKNDPLFGSFPIEYHSELHFFRCDLCGTGVRDLELHFGPQGGHPDFLVPNHSFFWQIYQKYPMRNPYLSIPAGISTDKPWPRHIQGIESIDNGYACRGDNCTYVTAKRSTMSGHNSYHHWKEEKVEVKSNVCLQRFFAKNNKADWFPSTAPLAADQPSSSSKRTSGSKTSYKRKSDQIMPHAKRIRKSSPIPDPASSSTGPSSSQASTTDATWTPEPVSPAQGIRRSLRNSEPGRSSRTSRRARAMSTPDDETASPPPSLEIDDDPGIPHLQRDESVIPGGTPIPVRQLVRIAASEGLKQAVDSSKPAEIAGSRQTGWGPVILRSEALRAKAERLKEALEETEGQLEANLLKAKIRSPAKETEETEYQLKAALEAEAASLAPAVPAAVEAVQALAAANEENQGQHADAEELEVEEEQSMDEGAQNVEEVNDDPDQFWVSNG